jgi:L-fuconolactonase
MKIDSHQHFWQYNAVKHSWIDDSMSVLQKDFLPADIFPHLQQNGFDGCVTVQCETSGTEITDMLQYAASNSFIKGVVGWADFTSSDIATQLQHYAQFPLLKGFRHVVQAEPDADFLLRTDFCNGIAQLQPYGFTYDILIYPHQLRAALKFVQRFPNQLFVIDHIAKPYISNQTIEPWATYIKALGAFENVYCKVSGMVTEADWHNWQPVDFTPYLDVVFGAFGTQRTMFGSDWPVCNVAGGYKDVCSIPTAYLSGFSAEEQAGFWGGNACRFYQLI